MSAVLFYRFPPKYILFAIRWLIALFIFLNLINFGSFFNSVVISLPLMHCQTANNIKKAQQVFWRGWLPSRCMCACWTIKLYKQKRSRGFVVHFMFTYCSSSTCSYCLHMVLFFTSRKVVTKWDNLSKNMRAHTSLS